MPSPSICPEPGSGSLGFCSRGKPLAHRNNVYTMLRWVEEREGMIYFIKAREISRKKKKKEELIFHI